MNFFEGELRKIFADSNILENPTYVGRSCYGDIGKDLRARIEFAINDTIDHYSTLRITILNRTGGTVDQIKLRLDEILGTKAVPGNINFPGGVKPYIWTYRSESEWYAFKPVEEDYRKMHDSIGRYIDVFRTREERKPALESTIDQAKKHTAAQNRAGNTKEVRPEPEL